MDTSDPLISFDEKGQCSHCYSFKSAATKLKNRKLSQEEIFSNIREKGKDKEYDCILGLSGGLDSSYLALLA